MRKGELLCTLPERLVLSSPDHEAEQVDNQRRGVMRIPPSVLDVPVGAAYTKKRFGLHEIRPKGLRPQGFEEHPLEFSFQFD